MIASVILSSWERRVGLKERIEELFSQHGLTPASGSSGHADGYLVEPAVADSLIVRRGHGAAGTAPWQAENHELSECARILINERLRVKHVRATRGGYLVVMEN